MTKQIEALKLVIDFLNREGFIEEHEIQNVIETCKEALSEAYLNEMQSLTEKEYYTKEADEALTKLIQNSEELGGY